MTPVKTVLSGRRYSLPVTGSHGEKVCVYLDNAVKGKIHLVIGKESVWIDNISKLLGILNELIKEETNV